MRNECSYWYTNNNIDVWSAMVDLKGGCTRNVYEICLHSCSLGASSVV
jgi:hypothetical protein